MQRVDALTFFIVNEENVRLHFHLLLLQRGFVHLVVRRRCLSHQQPRPLSAEIGLHFLPCRFNVWTHRIDNEDDPVVGRRCCRDHGGWHVLHPNRANRGHR